MKHENLAQEGQHNLWLQAQDGDTTMGKRDLLREFETLLDATQKHQRGSDFEGLLSKLFYRDGLRPIRNAGVAKPRQTDIYAKRFHEEFIIEAKWRESSLTDIADIDSLRARLARAPAHLIGMLFSMSGFTETAISDVESRREREIFLFDDYEIYHLFSGDMELPDLISRKREHLRAHGEVLFCEKEKTASESWGDALELPTTEEFIEINGKTSRSFTAHVDEGTNFAEIVFARSIPDASWNQVGGPTVDLSMDISDGSPESLRKMFGWIHQRFGLSGSGTFSIQQTDVSWFGIGLTEFLEELARQEARYRESDMKHVHHSEEVSYFDEFEEGFLVFHGRSRAESGGFVYSPELLIRLPGVPVDSRPYIELAEAAGNRKLHFIQPIDGKIYPRRFGKRISVKPLARIVNRSDGREPIVKGLVIENPFFNQSADTAKLSDAEGPPLRPLSDDDPPLQLLNETSVFVCALSNWHGVDDVVDEYYLRSIDATWGPGGLVITQPSCSWGEILNKAEWDPAKSAERLKQHIGEQKESDKWRKHFEKRSKPRRK